MFRLKLIGLLLFLSMNAVWLGGCSNPRIEKICDFIEQGDKENAMDQAEKIDDYDQYVTDKHMIGLISVLTQGAVDARTPLLVACKTGNIEMMKYLLENGADPNFGEKAETYPLVSYCEYSAGKGEDGVELLLSYGADPNLTRSAYPVDYLIRKIYVLKCDEDGVFIDCVDDENQAEYDMLKQQVVELIDAESVVLQESSKKEGRYYSNNLADLVRLNEVDMIRALLKDEKLIECINVQDEKGYTPLMIAAENGQMEICQLLLEYNADKTYVNDDNLSAYDLAINNENIAIAEMLQ